MNNNLRKILIVDDNPSVHEDYRKVLMSVARETELDDMETSLFGKTKRNPKPICNFEIESAYQGEEGLEKVQQSIEQNSRYAVAFVDMRMPPGWDGIRTVQELWNVDPNLPVVICTAYTDHSWEEITEELPRSELLLILKKPFDSIELKQMAMSKSFLRELVQNSGAAL